MPREGEIEEIRLGLSLGALYLVPCCFRQFRVLLNVEKSTRRNRIFSHYRFRSYKGLKRMTILALILK